MFKDMQKQSALNDYMFFCCTQKQSFHLESLADGHKMSPASNKS